jgi:hypothetical protein
MESSTVGDGQVLRTASRLTKVKWTNPPRKSHTHIPYQRD